MAKKQSNKKCNKKKLVATTFPRFLESGCSPFKLLKWSVFNGPSGHDYYELYFCSTKTISFYAIFNLLFCLKSIFTHGFEVRMHQNKHKLSLCFVCSTSTELNPFASPFPAQNNNLTTFREDEEETRVKKQIKQRRLNIMSFALQLVSICLLFRPSFLLFVLF